jgi:excinuclease ABC subunit B
VSCIYGIGPLENYQAMTFRLHKGQKLDRTTLLRRFVEQQYKRNDNAFQRGTFRVRGDTIDLFPAHYEDRAWRFEMFGDEIESITEFDPLTGDKTLSLSDIIVYANSHYVTPKPTMQKALEQIKTDLKQRLDEFNRAGRRITVRVPDEVNLKVEFEIGDDGFFFVHVVFPAHVEDLCATLSA